jgi:hypothetical protein
VNWVFPPDSLMLSDNVRPDEALALLADELLLLLLPHAPSGRASVGTISRPPSVRLKTIDSSSIELKRGTL